MTKCKLDRINASQLAKQVRNQKTFSFTLFHVTWLQEDKYLFLSCEVTFEVNCQSCHISDISTVKFTLATRTEYIATRNYVRSAI